MHFSQLRTLRLSARWFQFAAVAALVVAPRTLYAKPFVEFDFARVVACRDVTPETSDTSVSGARLIAVVLPVSVRFHGIAAEDVDELAIEISGAAAGLRVHDFSPTTQLASDVAQAIESTTTTKKDRSIDATLGGQLPVPYAKAVAHIAPSINVAAGNSEIETEKLNRLPPKHPIVVSGTSSEGRGVFFKLKRSSQTTLEGVHELTVVFTVPHHWHGDAVEVSCTARGRRELLWIEQPAILGSEIGTIELHLAGNDRARRRAEQRYRMWQVAKPIQPSSFEAAAAEMIDNFELTWPSFERQGGTPKASSDGRSDRRSKSGGSAPAIR